MDSLVLYKDEKDLILPCLEVKEKIALAKKQRGTSQLEEMGHKTYNGKVKWNKESRLLLCAEVAIIL